MYIKFNDYPPFLFSDLLILLIFLIKPLLKYTNESIFQVDMKTKRTGDLLIGGASKHSTVECPKCEKMMRSDKLKTHLLQHNEKVECKFCKKSIRSDQLLKHETLCQTSVDESLCDRRTGVSPLDDCDHKSSISGFFRSIELPITSSTDYDNILDEACQLSKEKLTSYVSRHPVKAQIVIKLAFYKERFGEREEMDKVFRSLCEPIKLGDDIDTFLQRAKHYIRARIDEYQKLGSGWLFEKSHCAHLELAKYNPLSASGKVNVPKVVRDMRSVLNITSPDNKCFLYSLAAGMLQAENKLPKINAYRHTNYVKKAESIDMAGISFPVRIRDVTKVEAANNLSISIFEWCTEIDGVLPLKHGSGTGTCIDLLYIDDGHTAHYLLIKEFNAFMRHRTKYHNSMNYCRKCFHGFTFKDHLEEHSERCHQGINQVVKMPESGTIEYGRIYREEKKPFTIYFDFECLTIPFDTCSREPNKKSTVKYQKHTPANFCIMTKSDFENYRDRTIEFSHENPNVVIGTFIRSMSSIHDEMMEHQDNNSCKINMTAEDEKDFWASKHCYLCKKDLQWGSLTNPPVRDHNHRMATNNYRGAACNTCNLNYYNRIRKVPAIAHNLKGYDLNLFLLDLVKAAETISVIPETIEKFKAVFTDKFTFLDSFAFMSTSLEKLAASLKNSGLHKFERLRKEFPNNYVLLAEKGVYFYDYASEFSVLSETKLPPKEAFFNKLQQKHISQADYERAQKVFEATRCRNLEDYTKVYAKTDVAILCDVFENFRNLCMSYYGLDCCHYVSLPAFAWDAMLKMTGVKIDYITDLDMYTFIEDNLRGGVTTINHRYFKANNKYIDDFDDSMPSTFAHYVDCNNLYGKGMELPLPTGNFGWLERQEIDSLKIMEINPDGDKSYILEVDLDYPAVLHDWHNDYPLAVQNRLILESEISPYNKEFLKRNKEKFKSTRKLTPDLHHKIKYVCSIRTLQLFIQQGLQLKKIHRVLTADQSSFLEPYIKFNSAKRLAATSKFESDFFKLANNAIYGKFIESLRNRTDVTIVKDPSKAKKLTSKPQFKGFQILDEDVTVVQSVKKTLKLDKPIACGFIVLENSKFIMGDFWYNTLKPMYGDRIKLLLSDTDSFIYGVETEDGYKDLDGIRHRMDLSGYDRNTPLGKYHDPKNKKVPGMFSDERPTEVIKEVIALKPKMYSLLTRKLICENKEHRNCGGGCTVGTSITAKGITKAAQKSITHEHYRECLEFRNDPTSKGNTISTVRTIRSYGHALYSISIQKRGLSAYDDKKYVKDNGIETLSYGHFRIPSAK